MGWNYRVLQHPDGFMMIHEVFFDDDDPDEPHSCSTDGAEFGGDTDEEIRNGLARALKALDKPVLSYSKFEHKKDRP